MPGMPSAPPAPVVAEGLPAANVVSVGGSGVDFTPQSSGPALIHQPDTAAGLGGAFNGKSAAPANPDAATARTAATAANKRFKEMPAPQ